MTIPPTGFPPNSSSFPLGDSNPPIKRTDLKINLGSLEFSLPVPEDFATTYTTKHHPNETYTLANFKDEFNTWKSGPVNWQGNSIDWQHFIHSDDKVKAGFYLLENYSTVHSSLTSNEDKKVLARIGKEFTMFLGHQYFNHWWKKGEGTNPSKETLEIRFFLFNKLFAKQNEMANLSDENQSIKEHKELISRGIGDLVYWTDRAWGNSNLKIDPRTYLELLIKNGIPDPIKKDLWDLFKKDNWHDLCQETQTARFEEDHPKDDYKPSSANAIVQAKLLQIKVDNQLAILEKGAFPNTKAKKVIWDFPVDLIANSLKGKDFLMLDLMRHGYAHSSSENELPNSMKFQLSLLEELGKKGFKNWYIDLDQFNLPDTLKFWLKDETREYNTPDEIKTSLQDYMDRKGGKPRIREGFIILPEDLKEPLNVHHQLNFWQQLWEKKEEAGATVQLFFSSDNGDFSKEAYEKDRKKCLFITPPYDFRAIPKNASAGHIEQTFAYPNKPEKIHMGKNLSYMGLAMSHVIHKIGENMGWGENNSSGIPILGNNDPSGLLISRNADLFSCIDEDPELKEAFDITFKKNSLGTYPAILVVSNDYSSNNEQLEIEPEVISTEKPVPIFV